VQQDPLTTGLCPKSSCKAVSHLICLSKDFLDSQPSNTTLVPRGGECTSCHTYVLWGDVIRGCYRRSAGAAVCEAEEDGAQIDDQGDVFESDNEQEQLSPLPVLAPPVLPVPHKKSTKSKGNKKAPIPKIKKSGHACVTVADRASSEGEFFDLDVSSTDESDVPSRKPGQIQKTKKSTMNIVGPSKSRPPLK